MFYTVGFAISIGNIVPDSGVLILDRDHYLSRDVDALRQITTRSVAVHQVGAKSRSQGGWQPLETAISEFRQWLGSFDDRCVSDDGSFWNVYFFGDDYDSEEGG